MEVGRDFPKPLGSSRSFRALQVPVLPPAELSVPDRAVPLAEVAAARLERVVAVFAQEHAAPASAGEASRPREGV